MSVVPGTPVVVEATRQDRPQRGQGLVRRAVSAAVVFASGLWVGRWLTRRRGGHQRGR